MSSARKRPRALFGIVLVTIAVVAAGIASCFSERQEVTEPPSGAEECDIPLDSPALGTVVVAIRGFAFVPANVTIKGGTRVTWVNCEPPAIDDHTSTSDAGVWESGLLPRGQIYSRIFDQVGSFPYHCIPHPFMQARITVE